MKLVYLVTIVAHFAQLTHAASEFITRNDTEVVIDDYTLQYGSLQDFENITDVNVFVYDADKSCPDCLNACESPTVDLVDRYLERLRTVTESTDQENRDPVPYGIIFETPSCSDYRAIRMLLELDTRIRPVGQLTALFHVIDSRNEQGSYDNDIRFESDPAGLTNADGEYVAVQRIHGTDPKKLLTSAFECASDNGSYLGCKVGDGAKYGVRATVAYAESPWVQAYRSPGYIFRAFASLVLFTFLFVACARFRLAKGVAPCCASTGTIKGNGTPHVVRILQLREMSVVMLISGIRVLECCLILARDVFGVWVPEVLAQLLWVYVYTFGLLAAWILLDYFSILIRFQHFARMMRRFIRKPLLVVVLIWFLVFGLVTASTVIYVYQVNGLYLYFRLASTSLLALMAVVTSVILLRRGWKIILKMHKGSQLRAHPAPSNAVNSNFSTMDKYRTMSAVASAGSVPDPAESKGDVGTPTLTKNGLTSKASFGASHSLVSKNSFQKIPTKKGLTTKVSFGTNRAQRSKSQSHSGSRPRKRAMARKMLPLTRLVIGCAIAMLSGAIVSIVASVTNMLSNPDNTVIFVNLLLLMEVTFTFLVAFTVTPLNPSVRRRQQSSVCCSISTREGSRHSASGLDEAIRPRAKGSSATVPASHDSGYQVTEGTDWNGDSYIAIQRERKITEESLGRSERNMYVDVESGRSLLGMGSYRTGEPSSGTTSAGSSDGGRYPKTEGSGRYLRGGLDSEKDIDVVSDEPIQRKMKKTDSRVPGLSL